MAKTAKPTKAQEHLNMVRMKQPRPLSHQVGPFTVRQDAGPSRTWRVFSGSVAIFHSDHLIEAFGFAQAKLAETITTVPCPACGARAGQRCISKLGESYDWPHTRRHDAYFADDVDQQIIDAPVHPEDRMESES